MDWLHTRDEQIEALEQDMAKLDRELERTPGNVVDWSAVLARRDRLLRDRARLVEDLRRMRAEPA